MRITQASEKAQGSFRDELRSEQVNPAPPLSPSQVQDLRVAAAQMTGAPRRGFQAEMTLKYCQGGARFAETRFGWNRETVEVGVAERRTGIECVSAHAAWSGRKRWEEKYPEAARGLRELAEAHAQQAPTFRTPLAYTRLTATAAREALRTQGSAQAALPAPSTLAAVVNRLGYRLRTGLKAKPHKKIPETDAIFANLKKKTRRVRPPPGVKRLSMDCKATVKIGPFSRGGTTRGETKASDHAFGSTEHYIPCGILDEATAQLAVTFGSSAKTRDFIGDTLMAWWQRLSVQDQAAIERIQLKMDNGPESSGVRTQFLQRLGHWVDTIGKPIQLLYYPPYHSK